MTMIYLYIVGCYIIWLLFELTKPDDRCPKEKAGHYCTHEINECGYGDLDEKV